VVGKELNVGAIDANATRLLPFQVLLPPERGEAPVLGQNDLLPAGELVLGSAEGLESVLLVYSVLK
jgi:hypothetical protein